MNLTPEQRRLRASIAAHSQHAQGRTNTEPARRAFMARFEDQVDPDRKLPEAERAKRAHHAMRAHMLSLNLRRQRKRQVNRVS